MRARFWLALTVAAGMNFGCADEPVQRVAPPDPQNPNSYVPQVRPKPMPGDEGQLAPAAGQPAPGAGPGALPANGQP